MEGTTTTPSSDHEMEQDDTAAAAAAADGNVAEVADDDEAPAFIHPDDADAEVVDVDLDHEPMDDEDVDDENVMTDSATGDAQAEGDAATTNTPVDMASAVIDAHDGPVYAIAVTAVGGGGEGTATTLRIASGGGDDRAFLTSYHIHGGGDEKRTTASIELNVASHRNTDTVSSVAFNGGANPEMLATGCYDGTIQLWEVGGGAAGGERGGPARHVRQLDGPTDVEWLSFHPNGGTVLLAGSTDGTTWMYHVPTGKCLQLFVGHEDDVSAGSFTSPDGKFAVTAGADGTLRVWAPRKGTCRHAFRNNSGGADQGFAEGALTCLAVGGGADGQLGMVGSVDGSAHVVHFGNKRVLTRLRHHDDTVGVGGGGGGLDGAMRDEDDDAGDDGEARSVEAVGFAPAGVNPNWCATGGVDGNLKIWDLTTGQCRQRCRHESPPSSSSGTTDGGGGVLGGVTRLAWHPTRPLIYTSASDGVVRLWDARSGRLVGSWTGHTDVINDMHVRFDEKTAAASNGGGESSSVVDVVVTGSDDGTVRVFEVDVEGCLAEAASAATSGM